MTQSSTQWTRSEDKLFEEALVVVPADLPDRWQRVADLVPGKLPREVKDHYEALVYDVLEIDSGRVELPSYSDESAVGSPEWDSSGQISFGSKAKPGGDSERKKGTPWTEEEHRYLFFFFFFPSLKPQFSPLCLCLAAEKMVEKGKESGEKIFVSVGFCVS